MAPAAREVPPAGATDAAPVASAQGADPAPPEADATPPAPPPRPPFAYANDDPDDDLVVGPPDVRATCDEELASAGVSYKEARIPVHVEGKKKLVCGAPQVVAYRKSPSGIAYDPPVVVTCTMALALARFETLIQQEALRTFGKRVVRIHQLGTYSCREMPAYPGWVSQHSYANAIDLRDFVLADGRVIDVYARFVPAKEDAPTPSSAFLRTLAQRAYDEEVFSVVLTPFFDAIHANHLHVDLSRYRSDGTRFGAR